jgi:thiamine biosynthesis lipoprotein
MASLIEARPTELREVAYKFRAMNTEIELLIYTDAVERAAHCCYQTEQLFAEAEAVLSRFRPTSELCRLNRQGWLESTSDLLYQSVADARRMAELTGGIFDPTILDMLEAAGYDRSFDLIKKTSSPHLLHERNRVLYHNWQQLTLEPEKRRISLPFGMRVDLGGIAKGSTVDRASQFLREAGFTRFMLSAGGDMFLEGCPPQSASGWPVVVANPLPNHPSESLTSLLVAKKGVATSAITGRCWTVSGKFKHHLIDPRTGEPTNNGLASATAVAGSVKLADVMAKTALILGPVEARKSLLGLAGLTSLLFVTLGGEVIKL